MTGSADVTWSSVINQQAVALSCAASTEGTKPKEATEM